jgi:hypothetical protein
VALGGQAERVHVVHLPTGANLGVVCREVPRLVVVQPSPDDETLACLGVQRNALWSTPLAPRAEPPASLSTATTQRRNGIVLQARGKQLRVNRRDLRGSPVQTGWFSVLRQAVAAVALSPDATRAVAASRSGEVAVLDLSLPGVQRVVNWHIPDGAAAVAVGWAPGPVVRTGEGRTWDVPDCSNCSTDAGLLARLRERMSGCWQHTQLANVDATTQRRLGAVTCRPPPPRLGAP